MLGTISEAVEFNQEATMELFNEERERLDELGAQLQTEITLPDDWEFSDRDHLPEPTAWGDFPNPDNDDTEERGWTKDAIIAEAWHENGNDSLHVYGFAHVTEVYAFVEKEEWGTNRATGEFPAEGPGREAFIESIESMLE